MAFSSGGGGRPLADINVTPMVDVMLVLLIIFMVTAPLMQQGVPVELPQTRAQTLDVQEDRLVLSLTADKQIFLGDSPLVYASLRDTLVGNLKLRDDKQLYLHADRALPYGFVVDIMAILKDAGVENLGMVTDPLQEKSHR
ncbi:MAG: ExbD/TolR family protein [Deltaproteobacteria bacterium]|nr:MAG: ExbD/TolR family protein [Deltaproteobacteria bacterium]